MGTIHVHASFDAAATSISREKHKKSGQVPCPKARLHKNMGRIVMGRLWKSRGRSGSRPDLLRAATLEWRRQLGLAMVMDEAWSRDQGWVLLLELYIAQAGDGDFAIEVDASDDGAVVSPRGLEARRLVRAGLANWSAGHGRGQSLVLSGLGREKIEAYLATFCQPLGESVGAAMHENALRAFEHRFNTASKKPTGEPMPRRMID